MQDGIQWPSYGREGWRETLAALDRKLHIEARPQLFSEDAFFDIADAVARVHKVPGSLAMRLPEQAGATRPVSGAIPIVQ